eukprot:5235511-Prymnesium_polylepis.3
MQRCTSDTAPEGRLGKAKERQGDGSSKPSTADPGTHEGVDVLELEGAGLVSTTRAAGWTDACGAGGLKAEGRSGIGRAARQECNGWRACRGSKEGCNRSITRPGGAEKAEGGRGRGRASRGWLTASTVSGQKRGGRGTKR